MNAVLGNLSDTETKRLRDSFKLVPTPALLRAVGVFLLQQVKTRFDTAGASGNANWPPKRARSWGYDDGRGILTGHSAQLKRSFFQNSDADSVSIGSALPYAKTHQHGATIRPKNGAKALFIPLTDRAITSHRYGGAAASAIRTSQKLDANGRPVRMATGGGKKLASAYGISDDLGLPFIYSPLKAGRLKDGQLQVKKMVRTVESSIATKRKAGPYGFQRKTFKQGWKEVWVNGQPDFIFLAKAVIPPRGMLPNSAAEQAAVMDFIANALAPAAARAGGAA